MQWQRSVHSHLHISSNIHTCIHSSIFTGHLQDDKCHTSSAMQDAKDVVDILYMNIIHEQNLKYTDTSTAVFRNNVCDLFGW